MRRGRGIRGSGAGAGADRAQPKHQLQGPVATLADAAAKQLFARDEKSAGIRELEPIDPSVDDDPALARIVSVDQGVDQGFLERIENRRSCDPIPLCVRLEGPLDARAGRELQHDR